MNKKILIDTDLIVDFLRGYNKAVAYLKSFSPEIVLSPIVIAELFAGVRENEGKKLEEFISLFPIIPITLEIAKVGGLFKRDYYSSHGVGLADALLAATAVIHNLEFKTMNTRHYPMFKGLKPPYMK